MLAAHELPRNNTDMKEKTFSPVVTRTKKSSIEASKRNGKQGLELYDNALHDGDEPAAKRAQVN